MNQQGLISELLKQQKNIQAIIKLLREIFRFDKNIDENLFKIKQILKKLNQEVNNFEQRKISTQNLTNWISQYESKVKIAEEKVRKQLGNELGKELGKLGLSLSGHYPKLIAGLFTIELDFDHWKATLWYGPKQEQRGQHPLSASKIATHIEKEREKLGSHLPPQQLLEKLHLAYHRAVGMEHGKPAPIIKVLTELSYLLQSSRFLQDPKRENYKSYSRADFSYDLFRIRQFRQNILFASNLHLIVATRIHTKRRSDFLWVPDDERGKGTVYSHLQFKEKKV